MKTLCCCGRIEHVAKSPLLPRAHRDTKMALQAASSLLLSLGATVAAPQTPPEPTNEQKVGSTLDLT